MALYTAYSDEDLVALLQTGDEAAYTEIYHRYSTLLLTHAYNKTGNREEARDLVHELFTQLWSGKTALQAVQNLSGFLYISLRNLVLNQVARQEVQHRYLASLKQFAQQEIVTADHLVREKQLMALIEKEIDALPPKMREVFKLSRQHHLSHSQIAAKLDISEQTVSKQITNALKILRTRLGITLYLLMITTLR